MNTERFSNLAKTLAKGECPDFQTVNELYEFIELQAQQRFEQRYGEMRGGGHGKDKR